MFQRWHLGGAGGPVTIAVCWYLISIDGNMIGIDGTPSTINPWEYGRWEYQLMGILDGEYDSYNWEYQENNRIYVISQMLHVYNIYLHLPQKWPKCRYTFHTWSIWAIESLCFMVDIGRYIELVNGVNHQVWSKWLSILGYNIQCLIYSQWLSNDMNNPIWHNHDTECRYVYDWMVIS